MLRAGRQIRACRPARLATTHPSCGDGHAMTAQHPSIPGVAFKDIDGFPGYCVGDDGSVWSCRRRVRLPNRDGRYRFATAIDQPWRRMTPQTNTWGYSHVALSDGQAGKTITIHSLVLAAFVGPCPPGMEACHYNGNRQDNRLENLRWDTPSSNADDRRRHGTQVVGESSPNAKLDRDAIKEIRRLNEVGWSQSAIARRLGVHPCTIGRVVRGKRWTHVA